MYQAWARTIIATPITSRVIFTFNFDFLLQKKKKHAEELYKKSIQFSSAWQKDIEPFVHFVLIAI
jgi:uncharacterized protein (DUF2062 family)